MLRSISHFAGSGHRKLLGRTPQLPGLTVTDHVKRLGAQNRKTKENAQILGFAKEDIAAERGELLDLTLPGTALGSDNLDSGIQALSGIETGINLFQEVIKRRANHHFGGPRLSNGADMGQASGQRRSQRDQPRR